MRPDTVVIVRTGRASVQPREDGAKVLFTKDLNRNRRRRFEQLADQARSGPAVVSPTGAELARKAGFDPEFTA